MAASFLLACGLQEHTLPKHIHISEESNIDGSFVISSMVGQRLRYGDNKALLVCLQNNFKHYLNAGQRLGFSFQMHNGKTLTVIDIVTDIGKEPLSSIWLNATSPTETLYKAICDELVKLQGNVTIIIDNLEGLLNLGASASDLYAFCIKLHKFSEESSLENFTLATKLNNCNVFEVTDANLETLSDLHLRLIKLKSGSFKEVDGRIAAKRWSMQEGTYESRIHSKNVLYKVNERNIKIFSPGEVGLK